LDGVRVDVLAEAGDAIVTLHVGAGDEARIAALDLRHHLGVGHRAAVGQVFDEAEERRALLAFVLLVEARAAGPGAIERRRRHRPREADAQPDRQYDTCESADHPRLLPACCSPAWNKSSPCAGEVATGSQARIINRYGACVSSGSTA